MKNWPLKISNVITLGIVVVMTLLSSCEIVVDADKLESNGNKVVVNSLIAPQLDVIEVEVSLSRPIIGFTAYSSNQDDDIISNAEVLISDDVHSMMLLYDSDIKKYTLSALDFPIVAGNTYSLTVTYNASIVSATCSVPYAIDNFEVEEKFTDGRSEILVTWQDRPMEENFYYVNAHTSDSNLYSYYFESDLLKSDNNRDGLMLSAKGNTYNSHSERIVTVQVLSTDENYYKYHKRLNEYVSDDPFSEPSPLTSNIQGGVGIFAAYNTFEETFIFN